MGLFDTIMDFIEPVTSFLSPVAQSFGGKALEQEFIGEPASAEAWSRSKEGALKQYQRSQASATTAWQRSFGAYKNRYDNTMKDMKNAGLNPILAASGGFNVGSGPSAPMASSTAPSPHLTQYPTTSAKDYNLGAEKARTESETAKNRQSILNLKKQAEETIAKTAQHRAQKKLITRQEQVALEQIGVTQQTFNKLTQEAYNTIQTGNLTRQQIKNAKLTAATMTANLNKLKSIANVYSQPVGDYITYISEIMKAIGLNMGIITGLRRR